jgi:hypothetical protein
MRASRVVLDTPAAEFRLPATDDKTYSLDQVAGKKAFIRNHCPYVKAVIDRMIADARVLMSASGSDWEAGPSQWLFSALVEAELPGVCVETRHMQAVLKAQINKTDRNDAHGIAQMIGAGFTARCM